MYNKTSCCSAHSRINEITSLGNWEPINYVVDAERLIFMFSIFFLSAIIDSIYRHIQKQINFSSVLSFILLINEIVKLYNSPQLHLQDLLSAEQL